MEIFNKMSSSKRPTRVHVYLNNLIHNLKAARMQIGKKPLICMPVKADAYGHGSVEISKTALENGASILLVAAVDEGVELREAGIEAPILLITQTTTEELDIAAAYQLVPFVSDKEYIAAFASAAEKTGKKHKVFLKIDTGMGRMGCRPEEALELARCIASHKMLSQMGTATHFAVSDSEEETDIEWTNHQIKIFKNTLDSIRSAGLDPGIASAANSGAVISHNTTYFDMVRPGIVLYGYQDTELKTALPVKPLMELVSQIVLIKKVHKGETVSYGRTWTAEKDTFIGILPVGYGDGLPRLLSTKIHDSDYFFVVINGEKYPLAGRICMDQCMINLGQSPKVKLYDTAILFGPEVPALNAADIAGRIGTISYEVCCNINKRVPRIYQYNSAPHKHW